ncbi:putative rna recognition domain-containing protein 2 [Erysiphe neolycopersici]|uniref:Putative rna recognition domain-containing protein 2 n=1 Tax=Erysiphe neolycopersici TaxID=212602 RepID=A0A420HS22_9PEZI|nr:putative rna recognition domain-containing protein 2 [Erysiphe neolycopersici]
MSDYTSTSKDDCVDPFISHTSLSATALPFLPKLPPINSFMKTKFPIPGTTQHLEQIIEANEGIEDFGSFTTNTSQSRNIKVIGGDGCNAVHAIENALTKVRPYYKGTHRIIGVFTDCWVRCSNIRDAITTYEMISKECPEVSTQYVSLREWIEVISSPGVKVNRSEHEGQVVVRLNFPHGIDCKQIERGVRALLEEDGHKLFASQKMPATAAGIFHLIAEFEDCLSSKAAVRRLDRRVVAGCAIINICLHEPDLVYEESPDQQCVTPTRNKGNGTPLVIEDMMSNLTMGRLPYVQHDAPVASAFASPISHVGANSGYIFAPGNIPVISTSSISPDTDKSGLPTSFTGLNNLSRIMTPLGPQTSSDSNLSNSNQLTPFTPQSNDSDLVKRYKLDSSANRYNSGSRRNSPKAPPYISRKNRQSNGTHNMVDINRIREGVDVRTTVRGLSLILLTANKFEIMLRNIPNKIDQCTLKSILDETSHGKYDFAYLRIDFSNDCNVGYAFVNFLDPLHIIEFINARANQKYRFRSQKIAEVSYATIQGRDCLIQKFRNSCVMLELPIFRPKLFYTFQDPLGRAGQEEPFPASDNPSKLRRSCENAEHVGLFAPNAGAQMRDEQRRRRSQYDRGTSLAQRDAYDVYLPDSWALGILENHYDCTSY